MEGATLRWLVPVIVVSVACLAGVIAAVPSAEYTVVVEWSDGQRIATIPANDGTELTLTYTHSVERTPVTESYVVEGTSLRQTRIEFSSYGWGFDSSAPVERTTDGRFVSHPDRTLDELLVSPGSIADHAVTIAGDRYELSAERGRTVRIVVVERQPLIPEA